MWQCRQDRSVCFRVHLAAIIRAISGTQRARSRGSHARSNHCVVKHLEGFTGEPRSTVSLVVCIRLRAGAHERLRGSHNLPPLVLYDRFTLGNGRLSAVSSAHSIFHSQLKYASLSSFAIAFIFLEYLDIAYGTSRSPFFSVSFNGIGFPNVLKGKLWIIQFHLQKDSLNQLTLNHELQDRSLLTL